MSRERPAGGPDPVPDAGWPPGPVGTAAVMDWVARYEQAWRQNDVEAVDRLFTPGAEYRHSPYAEPYVGLGEIRDHWAEDEGTTFTMDAEPVAVQGLRAVVRVLVRYVTPKPQEYLDLWVLRFAEDGRVAEYEEWPFWPGQGYLAD